MPDNRCQIGKAQVARVVEWVGPIAAAEDLFPETPEDAWRDHQGELAPTFWDPVTRRCRLAVQTWVIWVDGLTVVVDTGVGNDRIRPQSPVFHQLATEFDSALEAVGVDRRRVDVVINTHIHLDHVGWNTYRDGQAWRPMFPNARYLISAEDYRYFHPDNASARRAPRTPDESARFEGMRLVVEDSITPIADSDQLVTWSGDYRLSPSLSLLLTPGHTPGSAVLWLNHDAVFVGDLTHTPLQVYRPDDPCSFDLDSATATASRRRVLAQASSRGALVIPAHYPGRGATTVHDDGDGYRTGHWAALSPL
ncbi:MBL fold metallo-hydrolase [Mycobacterium sp. WMMD1722]|uniref:MBL fold metallo-hydrolase n=1 Tax=Mycobacterium sp. WMMD1722 TaxID=3404117 RepID=UPI003BF59C5F